jgi:hypothetical protein
MGSFVLIRPQDDAESRQASDWGKMISEYWTKVTVHTKSQDINQYSPADAKTISAAIGSSADLVLYFGHGDDTSWLTSGSATIDASNVHPASGKAVVSVACKTGCNLGPDAITVGVRSWLGFTIMVAVVAMHKTRDPFGDAMYKGIQCLGSGGSMQNARDAIVSELDQLRKDFDKGGSLNTHPAWQLGMFAAIALRDHTVLHGDAAYCPLP